MHCMVIGVHTLDGLIESPLRTQIGYLAQLKAALAIFAGEQIREPCVPASIPDSAAYFEPMLQELIGNVGGQIPIRPRHKDG